jgi:hypothetical protein
MGEALTPSPATSTRKLKLPKLDLPRPARWDYIAIGTLLVGLVLIGANLFLAGKKAPGEPFPSGAAALFTILQLTLSCAGLMLLGKTAKEGTWWGNLAACAAMLVGTSGVLLAAAMWAAA